jgi:hypothetical protein
MRANDHTIAKLSLGEFERLFESSKNWGRWGPHDEKGTMNYITPEKVQAAAASWKVVEACPCPYP